MISAVLLHLMMCSQFSLTLSSQSLQCLLSSLSSHLLLLVFTLPHKILSCSDLTLLLMEGSFAMFMASLLSSTSRMPLLMTLVLGFPSISGVALFSFFTKRLNPSFLHPSGCFFLMHQLLGIQCSCPCSSLMVIQGSWSFSSRISITCPFIHLLLSLQVQTFWPTRILCHG